MKDQESNHIIPVTRGHGLLEPVLARLRANQANRLINKSHRDGSILDIGCGSYPYFLSHTSFKSKFAIDQQEPIDQSLGIEWFVLDLNKKPNLPFNNDFFDVVTLLAVVEHLNPTSLIELFKETYRVLKPSGHLILTTPAAWSDGLLHKMADIGLVSPEEINEHVYVYTLPLLGWYFGRGGFSMQDLKFGYFEFMLNLWARAQK
jgi:SAM-dependent methyltransferase